MQGLLKYLNPKWGKDAISDCANKLQDIKRIKRSYPPEDELSESLLINLKA